MATGGSGGGQGDPFAIFDQGGGGVQTQTTDPFSIFEQPSPSPSPDQPQVAPSPAPAVNPGAALGPMTGAQLPQAVVGASASLQKPLYSTRQPRVPKGGTQFISKNDTAKDAGKKAGNIVDEAIRRSGQFFNQGTPAQCAAWVRDTYRAAGIKLKTSMQPLDWKLWGKNTGPNMANSLVGSDVGEIITDMNQLKPGDIVSFDNTYGNYPKGTITHDGIYIGDGEMVHRPTADKPVERVSIKDTGMKFRAGVRPYKEVGDTKMMVEGVVRKSGFTSDQDISLMMKLFDNESGFQAHDYNGKVLTSRAGARGIGQVMPATAAPYLAKHGWSAEQYDQNPVIQTTIATEITQDLLRRYDGNWAKALAAYNGGPGAVAEAETNGGWTPNSKVGSWYTETLPYVAKALHCSPDQAMKWIANGGGPVAQVQDPGLQERQAQTGFQKAVALSMIPIHIASMGLTMPLTDPAVQEVNQKGGQSPFASLFNDAKESTKYVAHGFLLALDGGAALLGLQDTAENSIIQSTLGDGLLGKGLDSILDMSFANLASSTANKVHKSELLQYLVKQTAPDGWQTPQREFPTQMRGGQDFVQWILGTLPRNSSSAGVLGPLNKWEMGPNKLMDPRAWEANAWSFGMEFPTLAAQTVALEFLGPSKAVMGVGGPGVLGRPALKPVANAIGTAGGGDIMWAMANKTGIGRQLGKEFFKNVATWGGLGAVQAGSIAAGQAMEEGRPIKEVIASAFVTGMFGYLMGVGIPLGLHAAASPVKASTNLLQPAVQKALQLAKESPVRYQLEKSFADVFGAVDKATGYKLSSRVWGRIIQNQLNTTKIAGERLLQEKMEALDDYAGKVSTSANTIRQVVADRQAQRQAAVQEQQRWQQMVQQVPPPVRTAYQNAAVGEQQVNTLMEAMRARPPVQDQAADAAWVQRFSPLAEHDKPITKSKELVKLLEAKINEGNQSIQKLLADVGATPETFEVFKAAEGLLQQSTAKVQMFDQDPLLGSIQDIERDTAVLDHFANTTAAVSKWLGEGNTSPVDPSLHKILEMPVPGDNGFVRPEEFAQVAQQYREGIEAIVGSRKFLDPLQDYIENITSRTSRALISSHSSQEFGIRYERLIDEARANLESVQANMPVEPRIRPEPGETPSQFRNRAVMESGHYLQQLEDHDAAVKAAMKTYHGLMESQGLLVPDGTSMNRVKGGVLASEASRISEGMRAEIEQAIPQGMEGLEKIIAEQPVKSARVMKDLGQANKSLLPPKVKKKDLNLPKIKKPREFTGDGPVPPEQFDFDKWATQQQKNYYDKLQKYEKAKAALKDVKRRSADIRNDEDFDTFRKIQPPRPIQKELLALKAKEAELQADLENINQPLDFADTGTHSKAARKLREASHAQRVRVETELEKVGLRRQELLNQYRGDQGKFFRYMQAREEFLQAKAELRNNPPPRTPKWWEADGGVGTPTEVSWRPELEQIFKKHPNIRTEMEEKILAGKVKIQKNKVGNWVLGAEDVEGKFHIDSTGAIPDAVNLSGHQSKAEAQAALKKLQEDIRASRQSVGKGPTIDRIRAEVEAKNAERFNKRQARVDKYQAEKAKRQEEVAEYQQDMADIENLPEVQKYKAYREAVESANQLRALYLDHGVDHGGFVEVQVPVSWIEPGATAAQPKGPVMLEDLSPSKNLTVFGGQEMLDTAVQAGEQFVKAVVPKNIWEAARAAKVPQGVQEMLPHTFGGSGGVPAAQQVHATAMDHANQWYDALNPARRGDLVANELQTVLDAFLQTPSQKRLMELEMMSQQPVPSWTTEIPADFTEFLEGTHLAKVGFENLLDFHAPASLRDAIHTNTFNAFMQWDDMIGAGDTMAEAIAGDFEKGLDHSLSQALLGPKNVKEFRANPGFREQMVDAMQALTTDPTQMQLFLQQHPHMQNPLRTYFGLYNAMEHFKWLSGELDSFFNDVGYPHIWETLHEISSSKSLPGSSSISTRYASEFARKIPTIAEGRKIYQKALYGDSEGGRQSVGLMNATGWKNSEPKTIRAREDLYISMQPGERCRVLGLDPTIAENVKKAENILMGIGLRDPITDPTKVLRLQISAVMRADANRNLIKNLGSIPVPGTGLNPHTGRPYMMVDYFANHETPGRVPVLRNGEIRANSPFPDQQSANYASLASDQFGLNEHATLRYSGMDVPAKNLFIHPDAADLMRNRFGARASEVGSVTKSINELMRAMKLAGSPIIHMNNLYSQHVTSLAALAVHSIDQSLRARNLSGVGRGFKDLALSPVDAAGMVAAGNRIGMDTKLYSDAVRSGVNLVTWNNQAKTAVSQAMQHLGTEAPDVFQPEELTGFTQSPARIMESAKDEASVDSKIRRAIDFNPIVSAVKNGEGASGVAKALGGQLEAGLAAPLKVDYLMNKYMLFNTARQAQVAAFHHWASVFWHERGGQLLDKGMPADAALSLIKREAAQYVNVISGSMNHYMDPAWARNATYGNIPVVGNLFAAMAPGWLRTKNHQMMSVFNPILERTWIGKQIMKPIEATGGVAEFARTMDPGVKNFLEGQWRRTFALGMVGGLMGLQMLNMMMNQGRTTWQSNPNNPEKWTSFTIGDKTFQWPFWGANKEAVKILDRTTSGDVIGGLMQQFSNNMFTPIAENIIDIGRNQDRSGNKIYNPDNSYDTLGERAGDTIKYVASKQLNLQELMGIKLSHGVFSRVQTPEWIASLVGANPSSAPAPARERAEMEEAKRWYSGRMAAENASDLQLIRRTGDVEAMNRLCQKAMVDGIESHGRYANVMGLQYGDRRYRMSGEQVKNMVERQIDPIGSAMEGLPPAARAVMWDRIQYWQSVQASGPAVEWAADREEQEEETP